MLAKDKAVVAKAEADAHRRVECIVVQRVNAEARILTTSDTSTTDNSYRWPSGRSEETRDREKPPQNAFLIGSVETANPEANSKMDDSLLTDIVEKDPTRCADSKQRKPNDVKGAITA
ncbi:hypothetical protein Tco_1238087 [Tanacetum coccineum]